MPVPRKYPPKLPERAIRLVTKARKEDPELSLNAAVIRIVQRVGVNLDTFRGCWPGSTRTDVPGPRAIGK